MATVVHSAVTATERAGHYEKVARALAKALGEDVALREQLKAEGLKKFDGDFDVLYAGFAQKHTGFKQKMEHLLASNGAGSAAGIEEILQATPTLNVSIPKNIDKWNTATFSPLVTFISAGFNERATKLLKAFDQDGKVHWLDAKKAPDFPVIVINAI
ncbi:DUF3103 family protein [Hymenobacter sp. BT730]|uniref:DUF3103 family protein n=1 Tax=Hymenobacter sp. BT730 TaxID=3063332 RepID=UPI0026DF8DA9|nr:DUF3103 family protein [Hymenobacter sp. BT730]